MEESDVDESANIAAIDLQPMKSIWKSIWKKVTRHSTRQKGERRQLSKGRSMTESEIRIAEKIALLLLIAGAVMVLGGLLC